MALEPVEIDLKLVDDKVKLEAISKTNPDKPIRFDYVPPLGTGDGFAGIEMLAMTFAGCVSTAVLGLLKRRGKQIQAYSMNVTGIKREEPLSLESIEFTAEVRAEGIQEQDLSETIALAGKISPVWLAVKGNVKVSGQLICGDIRAEI